MITLKTLSSKWNSFVTCSPGSWTQICLGTMWRSLHHPHSSPTNSNEKHSTSDGQGGCTCPAMRIYWDWWVGDHNSLSQVLMQILLIRNHVIKAWVSLQSPTHIWRSAASKRFVWSLVHDIQLTWCAWNICSLSCSMSSLTHHGMSPSTSDSKTTMIRLSKPEHSGSSFEMSVNYLLRSCSRMVQWDIVKAIVCVANISDGLG